MGSRIVRSIAVVVCPTCWLCRIPFYEPTGFIFLPFISLHLIWTGLHFFVRARFHIPSEATIIFLLVQVGFGASFILSSCLSRSLIKPGPPCLYYL